jgi:hypothetical protein
MRSPPMISYVTVPVLRLTSTLIPAHRVTRTRFPDSCAPHEVLHEVLHEVFELKVLHEVLCKHEVLHEVFDLRMRSCVRSLS